MQLPYWCAICGKYHDSITACSDDKNEMNELKYGDKIKDLLNNRELIFIKKEGNYIKCLDEIGGFVWIPCERFVRMDEYKFVFGE